MVEQVLSPGVQHAEEADLSAEMAGIGCRLGQGFRTGTEQQTV